MPFGFWVLGNAREGIAIRAALEEGLKCLSAFGFWGTRESEEQGKAQPGGLKCLSAFGFWGTSSWVETRRLHDGMVSNAFRLLGSGELRVDTKGWAGLPGLKCLSAFGFWGTPHSQGSP